MSPDDSRERPDGTSKGKCDPPLATRFRRGQSGNPKGRPKGRHREAPYDSVLGQLVTVRESGNERRITAAEAFLLHLTKRGLEGDSSAARATIRVLDEVRGHRLGNGASHITFRRQLVDPGSVNSAIKILRMAKLFDPYRDTAHILLEPWIVEAALKRLGDQQLNATEQQTVLKATRTPHKVKWPDWWTA